VAKATLPWQSKAILMLVLPAAAADLVLETRWWSVQVAPVAIWTLGLSALLGIIAWQTRSATPGGALTGAIITASLMFSTATVPYYPWQTALVPLVVLMVLTSLATRIGRKRKEQLGTAENRTGRLAAQVAANVGIASLLSNEVAQSFLLRQHLLHLTGFVPGMVFVAGLASLCEAAADTVSSELGQVFGARPRLITNFREMDPGTDGAVSVGGTFAGILAASLAALAGVLALHGDRSMFAAGFGGGVFGLFFDSLLGATVERRGWLNNDGVNFLSTLAAALFALALAPVLARS
jgi:uncharacterized protein (TIGR00297 family)